MKLRIPYHVLLLLTLVVALGDCTVQKRIYQKGYYISSKKKVISQIKVSSVGISIQSSDIYKNVKPEVTTKTEMEEPQLMTSAKKMADLKPRQVINRGLPCLKDTCGDVILLKDGTEIVAKVMGARGEFITYKYCNRLNGPLKVIEIKNLFMIKYANGTKQVFEAQEKSQSLKDQPSVNQKPGDSKETNGLAIASFIFGIFGILLIPAIVALICGIIALIQFKKQPEKYKGKWMAIVGLALAGIFLIMFIGVWTGIIEIV